MPDEQQGSGIDLSKLSSEELSSIQNAVLRQLVATRLSDPGRLAAGHDSHGSVHSKNSVLADLAQEVTRTQLGGGQVGPGPQ